MSLLDQLSKSLLSVYTEKLSRQEQEELMACLEVLADDQKYNKFKNLFPDEGEFRRELYKKHIEFFDAGAKYKERGFISANRVGKCLTKNQIIETCDVGSITMEELFSIGEPFYVVSWDEETKDFVEGKASAPFKKEKQEECVKLFLSNGKTIECAVNHRILTSSGWNFVAENVCSSNSTIFRDAYNVCLKSLQKYQVYKRFQTLSNYLLRSTSKIVHGLQRFLSSPYKFYLYLYSPVSSFQLPPQSILDNGLLTPSLGVQHWTQRVQGYQGCYLESSRLNGEQLQTSTSTSRAYLPLQDDVQQPCAPLSHLDGLDSKYTSIHQQENVHLSTLDAILRSLGRFVVSLCCKICKPYTQKLYAIQEFLRQHYVSVALLLPSYVTGLHRFDSFSFDTSFIDNVKIIAYKPIGCNDVYDFEVDTYHNYVIGGIVNHNSEAGCYEVVCHATGEYPYWWGGWTVNHPCMIWIGGDTSATVRDIIQKKLIGDFNDVGGGLIPKDKIVIEQCKIRRGIADAYEILKIKHVSGGVSTIVLKTYEQGRVTWQGTEVDFVWLDEECPQSVYGEALLRTMTTKGRVITTFTPLNGMTDVVLGYLENSQETDVEFPKHVTLCKWSDVPHLTEEEKAYMLANTPPQLRKARSEGDPTVGAGLIYPVGQDNFVVEPFKIPKHFQRAYGMDVGWNATAAIWGAWDRDNDIIYIDSEYKQGGELGKDMVLLHADAIKGRGDWIRGVIDPAARGRSQIDGNKLYDMYRKAGLKILPAENARESGIYEVYQRLSSGRLKVFSSCTGFLREISLYHRDDDGKIVKTHDHLLDCLRYLINSHKSVWGWQVDNGKSNVISLTNHMKACV